MEERLFYTTTVQNKTSVLYETTECKFNAFPKYSLITLYNILSSILDGTAIAACDWSIKAEKQYGMAAWTICSHNSSEAITGVAISPGPKKIQNAYTNWSIALSKMWAKDQKGYFA